MYITSCSYLLFSWLPSLLIFIPWCMFASSGETRLLSFSFFFFLHILHSTVLHWKMLKSLFTKSSSKVDTRLWLSDIPVLFSLLCTLENIRPIISWYCTLSHKNDTSIVTNDMIDSYDVFVDTGKSSLVQGSQICSSEVTSTGYCKALIKN